MMKRFKRINWGFGFVALLGSLFLPFYTQSLLAEESIPESLSEYECLYFNIGLLALLNTENIYFKRSDIQQYDEKGAIPRALMTLKNRGGSCVINKNVYVEAAEYSLHFRQLEHALYFLQKARP